MSNLDELKRLNEARCAARLAVDNLAVMNTPIDPEDRLKSDARYRLAQDAWMRAEGEYRSALGKVSTEDLARLTTHP